MVAFRRLFFALAVVILISGLASAQTPNTSFSCSAAVSVPPLLRSEGVTEQIGDIVLTCTGGFTSQYTVNATGGTVALPTANITVSLPVAVTSRLLGSSSGGQTPSEALLMIDEPGSGLTPLVTGSGPAAAQNLCTTPFLGAGAGGCAQYAVIPTSGNPQGLAVMSGSPVLTASGTAAAPSNMYLGLWNSAAPNQITFQGIPVLPPVSSGVARIFRITNIRGNASAYTSAGLAGTTALNASVSISSSTSVTLPQAVLVGGFIEQSLTANATGASGTSAGGNPTLAQCAAQTLTPTGLLQYREIFPSAFKIRNAGGQGSNLTQNVPGNIYYSESGFEISTVPAGYSVPTGLADYGTRFQATFHNIPSGVRLFVSVNNISNVGVAASATAASAVLIQSSGPSGIGTLGDYTTFSGGTLTGAPTIAAATTVAGGAIGVAEITPADSTGTAIAVWESITNNPAAIDSYVFGVYTTYAVTAGINSPPIPAGAASATTTVNMSYSPIYGGGLVTPPASPTSAAWNTASSSLTIPRFIDTSVAQKEFTIAICQTVLLFPFVTNTNGFDTGIAIANTTTDPFGTAAQAGVCNLNAYGNTPPTNPTACTSATTATGAFCMPGTTSTGAAATSGYVVSSGTVSATLASSVAPGFQGYVIAVCNFQLAHGFAFISDVGARNLAMGYLALIIPTGTGTRVGVEALEN